MKQNTTHMQQIASEALTTALGAHKKRSDVAPEKRVERHLHTTMSAMDALTDARAVIQRAESWGHKAIAITDHGVVQAFPDAWRTARNIKVIYGVEAYFVNDVVDRVAACETQNQDVFKRECPLQHITILARSKRGLRNLYKLVSESHLNHFKRYPIMPMSLISANRDGLILGSACQSGEVYDAVRKEKDWSELKRIASWYDFLEIQPLCNQSFEFQAGTMESMEDMKDFNRTIVALGKELGKPVCATGNVHFLDPEDEIFRRILLDANGFDDCDAPLPLYFKTTEEMLEEFSYLGKADCYDVVVRNTNLIADWCERIDPLPQGSFTPKLEHSAEELSTLVWAKAKELYGEKPPQLVVKRIHAELGNIMKCTYDGVYMAARKLVQSSLARGYLVGARDSLGSSLVAFMSGITEINPLPPHYRCLRCKHSDFETAEVLGAGCGADMKDEICPMCGAQYAKDGFNIPFETFLGSGGDNMPYIGLTFASTYQAEAQHHLINLFGKDHVFCAGTIGTVSIRTVFNYVEKYMEERGLSFTRGEKYSLANGGTGIKHTTSHRPDSMVVIPQDKEIYDFCPIQQPIDDVSNEIVTTHFDHQAMASTIFKLDIVGCNALTMIYMLEGLTGVAAREIPLDDPDTMSIFTSSEALGFVDDKVLGPTGTCAIPEFGTSFVRGMLENTEPTELDSLVRISGFSHGTDVWLGNAKDLITSGTATVGQTIGCRDDIMCYLIKCGFDPERAFAIMEAVQKGRGLPERAEEEMHNYNVPDWYIGSCKKIKYLFPKAHAVSNAMMAFRVAWFKLHRPLAFYATYFSVHANTFDAAYMCHGIKVVQERIAEVNNRGIVRSAAKGDMLTTLEVCYEFYLRGFHFEPISTSKSHGTDFLLSGKDALIPPWRTH